MKQAWEWHQKTEKTKEHSEPGGDAAAAESAPTQKESATAHSLPSENIAYLHELIAGSSYFAPAAPLVEKDPQLVKRLDRMRAQVENRLYAKMVENVSNEWRARTAEEARADLKTGLDTAKLSLNLLLSPVCVFGAVYFVFWAPYRNVTTSIIAGTIAAIFIFMVEMLLFVIRGSQLDAKVASQRYNADMGIQSPFPPAAPSILAAQLKAKQERIEARRAQRLLASDPAAAASSTNARDQSSNSHGNPTMSSKSAIDDFQLPTLPAHHDSSLIASEINFSPAGPVIDDEEFLPESKHLAPLLPFKSS